MTHGSANLVYKHAWHVLPRTLINLHHSHLEVYFNTLDFHGHHHSVPVPT
jgi:hypothetical protein